MTDLHDQYPDAAEENDGHTASNIEVQVVAHEAFAARNDLRANDLALRTIGDWTVVGHKRSPQGRNVYVLRHRDGHLKGVKGHVLNAMLTEARLNGVAA